MNWSKRLERAVVTPEGKERSPFRMRGIMPSPSPKRGN